MPVSNVAIGPIYKRDVVKASVMLERQQESVGPTPFIFVYGGKWIWEEAGRISVPPGALRSLIWIARLPVGGHPPPRCPHRFATILGFDVTVDPEAQRLADEMGVRIFTAPIIYHLTDMFGKYISDIREQKKARDRAEVVFPCQLTVVPNCIFNRSSVSYPDAV